MPVSRLKTQCFHINGTHCTSSISPGHWARIFVHKNFCASKSSVHSILKKAKFRRRVPWEVGKQNDVKVLEKWRNYLILFLRAWPHFAGDVLEPQTLQSLVIIKMWQKGNKHSHEQQTGPKIEWTQCKIPSLGPMVNTYLINLFYFLRKDIELSKGICISVIHGSLNTA